jgi:hypothetical protein
MEGSGLMRTHILRLSFVLVFATSGLFAHSTPLKLCVSQDSEGYDALRLARELSSRKLKSGAFLAVVVISTHELSTEEEHKLADPSAPFARVLLAEKTPKARDAEIERLGCDYIVRVWLHESADNFDANSPAGIPNPMPGASAPPPMGDRTVIGYELRKPASKKVLARATAPPMTVYVRQGRRVFNPYLLFANQILKRLDNASN